MKNRKLFFKRITVSLLMLVLVGLMIFVNIPKAVQATGETQYLTTGSGGYLTYRGSSEKVLALSEYDYPIQEYRAVWVSNLTSDISSYTNESSFKAEANDILDNMEKMGMNAIVFHIRTHNNALYNSKLNPRATYWANVNFDQFDPLTWLIEECHNRGIEFHAWLNPYRVSSAYVVNGKYPEGHPCNDSSNLLTSGSGTILNPGLQNVRDFIVDSCMEIVENYDVDAIHFDDYFYISGVETDKSDDWKRQQVDLFIEDLHNNLKTYNEENEKNVQLGISPSGIYRNGSYSSKPTYDANGNLVSPSGSNTAGFSHYGNYLFSDTLHWINEGWIDYITPQAYWGLEHTVASFAALTRWWSWAVANKDCNLYMGVGIYMAISSGSSGDYWRRNQNEVQNQMLNAAMYDEIDGLCFFKYSSMLSNDTIIKKGVDLIKNEYWTKKIPSAVQKSYANILPSYSVSNLLVVGNELNWDEIANVRGYMVYQVPKGLAFEKNNYDYLLEYTQDTKIAINNTSNYDYYVCSVNKANVISEEVKLKDGSSITPLQNVINQIDKLPVTITLENETVVNKVNSLYNTLSNSDKALVTNYSKLTKALETISKAKVLKQSVDNYLASISEDVESGVILTPPSGMTWSYQNASDVVKYNIETGKILVNYLAQTKITLVLTASDGDATYSGNKVINIGLIKSAYIPLIYRDDASCLTPYDEGNYTEGETGYIGWSNAILYLSDYAMPIAKGNYFRITDTTIPEANWHSCGAVYYNATSGNINIYPNVAFNTSADSYGYIIFGINNKVVRVSSGTPYTTAISLEPGQTLYMVRYLDKICSSSPFNDLTWINTSTDAFVTSYTETGAPSDQDKIDACISAINMLPTVISVQDEKQVNDVQAIYDALSTENKAKITNYQKLVDASNALIEAKKQEAILNQAKEQASNDLKTYVDLNNYSTFGKITITGYLNNAYKNINSATTIDAINTIVSDVKNKIDQVKTSVQELASAKQNAKDSLASYLNKENYSQVMVDKINSILQKGNTEIDEAVDETALNMVTAALKLELDEIPNKDEELDYMKKQAITELYASYNADDYDITTGSLIVNDCIDAEFAINAATTIEEINNLLATAKENIKKYPMIAQIEKAKSDALKEINDYVTLKNPTGEIKSQIDVLVNNTTEQINEEIELDKIEKYKNKCLSDIDDIIESVLVEQARIDAIEEITNYGNSKSINTELQTTITSIIDTAKGKINGASRLSNIETYKTNCINDIDRIYNEYISTYQNNAINSVISTIESKYLSDNTISLIVSEYRTKIFAVKTINEIDTLKAEFVNKINEAIKNSDSQTNCKKNSGELLLSILSVVSVLVLVFKKKH